MLTASSFVQDTLCFLSPACNMILSLRGSAGMLTALFLFVGLSLKTCSIWKAPNVLMCHLSSNYVTAVERTSDLLNNKIKKTKKHHKRHRAFSPQEGQRSGTLHQAFRLREDKRQNWLQYNTSPLRHSSSNNGSVESGILAKGPRSSLFGEFKRFTSPLLKPY